MFLRAKLKSWQWIKLSSKSADPLSWLQKTAKAPTCFSLWRQKSVAIQGSLWHQRSVSLFWLWKVGTFWSVAVCWDLCDVAGKAKGWETWRHLLQQSRDSSLTRAALSLSLCLEMQWKVFSHFHDVISGPWDQLMQQSRDSSLTCAAVVLRVRNTADCSFAVPFSLMT